MFFLQALSSQLEAIIEDEQKQMNRDQNNDSAGGTSIHSFWNNDETYEDYYNEGRSARHFIRNARVCRPTLVVRLFVIVVIRRKVS